MLRLTVMNALSSKPLGLTLKDMVPDLMSDEDLKFYEEREEKKRKEDPLEKHFSGALMGWRPGMTEI